MAASNPGAKIYCPRCQSPMELHWKFCITCQTRHEPAAFIRIAQIDTLLREIAGWPAASLTDPATQARIVGHYQSERNVILDRLRPEPVRSPNPAAPPRPSPRMGNIPPQPAEGPNPAPFPEGQSFTPVQPIPAPFPVQPRVPHRTLLERLADPATLKLLIYGGGLLMTIGALIYLRDLIAAQLQKPIVQAAILALVTAATYSFGLWLIKRTKADLIGRGFLLIGALLMPLNPWFLVYSKILPRGDNGWAVGFVCAAIYMGTAVLLQETLLLYLAIPTGLLSGIGFLDHILKSPPEGFVFFAALYGTTLFAHSRLRKTSFAAGVTNGFGQVILTGAAFFALFMNHSGLSLMTALMCLAVGHFVPRFGLGVFHLCSGYVLLTAGYLERLDRLGILSSYWAPPYLTVWLLAFFCAYELAAKIEQVRQVDRRWSRSLQVAEWIYAAPALLTCVFLFPTSAIAPVVLAKNRGLISELTIGFSKDTFAMWLSTVPLFIWSARRFFKTESGWYSTALTFVLYAGCGLGALTLKTTGMTATLTLLGFTILLRALAEVWGANLGNQFGTSPDTHFGVDFGLPSRPGTEPFRVLTDLFSLLTGFAIVGVSLLGNGHPLFAVAMGLITVFFLGAGFVAGNEKRAIAAYAVGSCAGYALALCLLHNNFHLNGYRVIAGLSLTAVVGHFASFLVRKSVSEHLGKAMFGVTAGLFAVLVFLSVADFTDLPGHRLETLLVFGCATLCFAHAAVVRSREFGYAAAISGAFGFARLFQLGHLPNREFPTAYAIYGFLLLLAGMYILPRREKDVLENERLSPVLMHCGHFFTTTGLIGVVLMGLDLPLGTMERIRHLGGLALGILIGTTVTRASRHHETRVAYGFIGLFFSFLTVVQSLRIAGLTERDFPTVLLLFGFATLLIGLRGFVSEENRDLKVLFIVGGHIVTLGAMFAILVFGIDLPSSGVARLRYLAGPGLAVAGGAAVAALARDRATRMAYAGIGLAFLDFFCLQTLRATNVADRNFPAVFLLLGFAQLVLGIQILPKLVAADPEAPNFAGLLKTGGHLLTIISLVAVGLLGISLSVDGTERITLLASLGLAIGTTATIGTVARERAFRELYSFASIGFTILFYMRTLNIFGISVLDHIEFLTIPLGALLMGVGWFKLRGRDAGTGLGEVFLWLGGFLFCVPVMLHAFQIRFERGSSARLDILTDTVSIAALAGGWWLRQRGPVVFGGSVLALHLSVVILDSVKWGQIPYAVYLFGIGSAFFGLGAVVWQISRHPEWLERVGTGLRTGWRSRFAAPPRGR